VKTTLHEMFHVLGFSSGLYEFFLDKDGFIMPKEISQGVYTNPAG
jgi:hypothetical protein